MKWRRNMKAEKRIANDLDYEDTESLTQMLMRLFELWQLTNKEQANLLSLSPNTRTTLAGYRSGKTALPNNRDTIDRIKYLLSIHKNLRAIFPNNKELAYAWPKSPNKHFHNKSPIEVIIDDGFLGLVNVHNYLSNYMAR